MSDINSRIEDLMELREGRDWNGLTFYVLPPELYKTAKRYGFEEHADSKYRHYLVSEKHPDCRFYKSQPLTR